MEYELVEMVVVGPAGLKRRELVRRAKALLPCTTGKWENEDEDFNEVSREVCLTGNMECEPAYYERSPEANELGPDDAGVKIYWEKP